MRRILSYLYLEPETEEKDGRLCQKGVQKATYTGPNKMVRVQQIRIIKKTRGYFSHSTNDIIHHTQGIKWMVGMDGCCDFLSK